MNNGKEITIMPVKGAIEYHEKLTYFEHLINNLYKKDKYLLPVFLLRCQLVEFSLKYLLTNHPYKPERYIEEKIEKSTMGQLIGMLREMDDEYMKDIVEKASNLVDCRNKMTHNLLKSNVSISEIEKDIKKNMECADVIEQSIHYYLDFVDKTLHDL